MRAISDWTQSNQTIAIVIVICVSILLGLAMVFGLDLSWIPGLLSRMAGG